MKLSMDSIQIAQPCTVISRRQFTINHQVPGSSWYSFHQLNLQTTSCFKSVNPGLVIGNQLTDSLLFHYNKAMYKILKS